MHGSDHSHSHENTAPGTQGRTIRWAGHYDFVVKLLTLGRENTLRRQTLQQAAITSGETVLDVGCGTGTLTLLAKTETGDRGQVYGIDASPEMIAVARQKALQQQQAVDFQTSVIEALPFSDGTFDVVLSSLMFHHLPPDLKQRGLMEIYRVLKPGGRLIVVDMKRPTTLVQRFGIMALAPPPVEYRCARFAARHGTDRVCRQSNRQHVLECARFCPGQPPQISPSIIKRKSR